MKNKKILFKIITIIIAILVISIIILAILGIKERKGYLSDFKLNIDKTLEINGLDINKTIQLFTIDDKLDEIAITNFIFTNSYITNYNYHFKIKYYSKIFKNSDIYSVYPNINKILKDYNYILELHMDDNGSPFGNLMSNKIINVENIDNINYSLKLKNRLIMHIIIFLILIGILIYILLSININKIIYNQQINEIIFSCIIIAVGMTIVFIHFNINNIFSFGFPFIYETYGDQSQFLTVASMIKNEGWSPIFTDRLAYPFGRYLGTYTMFLFMNFEIVLMKIISIFINDPLYILHTAYYLIFPITFIISFFVMRNLKISRFMSVFGSTLFTFIPYVFYRQTSHYNYSTIYFIPLLILLCVWLYEDDNLLMPNKMFFKNKKNIISLIIIILLIDSGGGYYQFFSGFFICLTGLIKFFKTNKLKSISNIITVVIFFLFMFFIIDFLPAIIYSKANVISIERTIKSWQEAEIAALKLSHFLLNPKIFKDYYSTALLVNENITIYSGIIPIAGFIILIIFLLIRKNENCDLKSKFTLFSELNIFAILFATMGGFSSLFNFFITAEIRAYNRISVYIAYISILVFCIFIDNFMKKKNIFFYILFTCIFSFALYEQLPYINFFNQNAKNIYLEDKRIIETIEKEMPENSAIYQLPTVGMYTFFQNSKSSPYKHLIGYIFSKKLKWSYGSETTKKENDWYNEVNTMNAKDLLNEISYAGFDGLYIDKEVYGNNEYIDSLIIDIKNITGKEPIISSSERNIVFFDIRDFKKNQLDKNYIPIIYQYQKNK